MPFHAKTTGPTYLHGGQFNPKDGYGLVTLALEITRSNHHPKSGTCEGRFKYSVHFSTLSTHAFWQTPSPRQHKLVARYSSSWGRPCEQRHKRENSKETNASHSTTNQETFCISITSFRHRNSSVRGWNPSLQVQELPLDIKKNHCSLHQPTLCNKPTTLPVDKTIVYPALQWMAPVN